MEGVELPPVAPLLMQSLRAVGYSTAAALADLADNSIAAGATGIDILLELRPLPVVTVIDNGSGMDGATLVTAMRFGSRDPREARIGLDLGRFGLGLKTASLSQCRRFTVISLTHGGNLEAAAWDLDECERRCGWWLERPSPADLPPQVLNQLQEQGHGTAVIWSALDRIAATGGPDPGHALGQAMIEAADHLALVFHRFISGEMVPGFSIRMNSRPLERVDPFLQGHARGQALHPETFVVDHQTVEVSPFVLPFPSRLVEKELLMAGGRESLKTGHGFYVYRGGRLVVPGGWFRIVPADQLIRLARVRVDVPVALDHLWKVDIRKTMAEPPAALRPHLRRIVGDVTVRSRRVYSYRGTPNSGVDTVPLWRRHDDRDGAASWLVNRDHPAVASLLGVGGPSGDVEGLIRLIEAAVPAHDMHLHLSNDLPVADPSIPTFDELDQLARRLVAAFADQPMMVATLLSRLAHTDPFNRNPDAARRIAAELTP